MSTMKTSKLILLMWGLVLLLGLSGCAAYREEALERMRKERESESTETYKNKEEKKKTFKGTSYTGKTDEQILDVLKSKKFRNLSSAEMDELMERVKEYLNTPYLWGGESKDGIDCSSFVQNVMHTALGVSLPRTSLEQSKKGDKVSLDNISLGDLLFFDTMNKGHVSHVGIYLDEGLFVHSGSRTGVAIAFLSDEFYTSTFLFAKRVF